MSANYTYERCFISTAVRLAQKKKMSKSDFGSLMFSKKDGYRTLQSLLVPSKPKEVEKPRALLLREAYAAAKALDLELSDLCTLVEKEMSNQEHETNFLNEGNASG